jgi:hypothetical protein
MSTGELIEGIKAILDRCATLASIGKAQQGQIQVVELPTSNDPMETKEEERLLDSPKD